MQNNIPSKNWCPVVPNVVWCVSGVLCTVWHCQPSSGCLAGSELSQITPHCRSAVCASSRVSCVLPVIAIVSNRCRVSSIAVRIISSVLCVASHRKSFRNCPDASQWSQLFQTSAALSRVFRQVGGCFQSFQIIPNRSGWSGVLYVIRSSVVPSVESSGCRLECCEWFRVLSMVQSVDWGVVGNLECCEWSRVLSVVHDAVWGVVSDLECCLGCCGLFRVFWVI